MTDPSGRTARVVNPWEVVAVAGLALVVYVAISRYLLVSPDTVVTLRNNVLFETDSGVRLRYLTDPGTKAATRLEFMQHPAFFLFWRPIGLGSTWLLRLVFPPATAAVLVAQALVCGAAAAGAGSLYAIARTFDLSRAMAVVAVVMLVLCTATVLVVVPEHWALAQGLMLISCLLVTTPGRPGARRLIALAVLCGLIAGTTITNAMFVLLLFLLLAPALDLRLRPRRWAPWLGTAAALAVLSGGWALSRLPHVAGFLNMRLVEHPARALAYAAFGLIGPVVGPVPHPGTLRGHLTLSYEPFSFGMYSPLQWVGVLGWVALLVITAWLASRDPDTRRIAAFLFAWLAFNLTFHNLWGDEFFLYSGHWAWALIVLAVIGMRRLRGRWIVPLAACIAIGQITTLLTIGSMLRGS